MQGLANILLFILIHKKNTLFDKLKINSIGKILFLN